MSAIAAPQKSPGKEVDLGPLKKGDVILTSENDGVWNAMLAAEDQIPQEQRGVWLDTGGKRL